MRTRPFLGSLFVARDVKSGEVFTAADLRSVRPADGLHPRHLPQGLGHHASCDIEKGTPVDWDMVDLT